MTPLGQNFTLIDMAHSTFFLRRSTLRSYSTLRQCWHEPVQGHIPRHCRPKFGLRPPKESGQLTKGSPVKELRYDKPRELTDDSAYVQGVNTTYGPL